MASSKIGGLFVSLDLNYAKFVDGLDKSRTKSTAFGVAVGNVMSNVALSFARMVGQAVGSLPKLIDASIDFADELNKTSQRTGIAVESLSALNFAAKLSDVSLESLSTGVGRLSRQMSEAANGSAAAEKIFKTLGVSATGANGALRPVEDVLGDVAEKFAGMEDGAQKTALALQVFGKGGQALIPLLNQGKEGLAAMTKEAQQLGLVISSDTAQAAEQFNDNLTRLQSVVDGVGLSLAEKLLPQLNAVTNAMVEFVKQSDLVESIGSGLAGVFADVAAYAGAIAVRFTALQLGVQELDLLIVRTGNNLGIFSDKYLGELELRISKTYERFDDLVELTQKLENLKVPLTLSPGFTAAPSISTKPFGPNLPKPGLAILGDDADKAQKKLESLRESFQRSLKPADDLAVEIAKLQKSFSDSDIIKVWGDRINKAADQQRDFEFTIPPVIAQFEALNQANKDAVIFTSLATREGEAWTSTLESIADGSLDTAIKLGILHEQMAKTADELEKLQTFGKPRDFGFIEAMNLDELKIESPKVQKQMEDLAKTGEQIGLAISSGIEDAIQKWEGFGKLAIGVLDDIAATILRNQVIAPLTGWLSDVLGSLGSVIGGIGGGAGSAASTTPFVGSFSFDKGGPVPHFAEGGEVPAILHSGEFVMNRNATQRIGTQALNAMNNGATLGGRSENVTYISIDARGAESGVEQKILAVMRQAVPGLIEASVSASIDRKLRTA